MYKNNILLLDDDPDVLSTLKASLENEAYGVYACEKVDEALSYIKNIKFSAALIDIFLKNSDRLIA